MTLRASPIERPSVTGWGLTQGLPFSGILGAMEERLFPCECCGRHMRTTDSSCPFCFSAQSAAWPPVSQPRIMPRAGTTRAALFAGALLMSPLAGVTACGGSEPIAQPYGAPPQPPPEETIAQPYGAPPPDFPIPTPDEDESDESEEIEDVPVPAYGGPPPPPPVSDEADLSAAYGAPPPAATE